MRQFHCLLTFLKLGKQTSLCSEGYIKTKELLHPAAQTTFFPDMIATVIILFYFFGSLFHLGHQHSQVSF